MIGRQQRDDRTEKNKNINFQFLQQRIECQSPPRSTAASSLHMLRLHRTRLPRYLTRSISSMSTASYKYVVLGAGNSAGYVAREFKARGVAPGELCLVGEEPVHPYERPALSKAVLMKDNVRLPGFHTCVGGGGERQTPEWYADNGIETMLGEKVTSVDLKSKSITTESEKTITATDALILATGASPIYLSRLEGANLDGVMYLRDNDQALKLYDALQKTKGKTVIVVGGGYIGLEVTAAAVTVGCKVKMLFPEEYVMPRLFTPEIAALYEKVYKDKGVEFLNNGRLCKAFVGNSEGKVCGVKFCKDEVEDVVDGDLVVVGVGARPNTLLFKDQLKMDARGGVQVDGKLQTSVPGVYAIGDIATFPLKMYGGRPVRMEHVVNARQTAKHAVGAIYGDTDDYDYLPYFYSRVFDLSWKFYGDSKGECLVVGGFDPKLLAVWVDEGKVNGVFMESPSDEDVAAMQKIARERPEIDVAAFKSSGDIDSAMKIML